MPQNALLSAKNRLYNAWENATTSICDLNSAVEIFPRNPAEVIRIEELSEMVNFSIKKPVLIFLPEKTKVEALKESTKELIIVVTGWLSFEKDQLTNTLKLTKSKKLKTYDFGTSVEYLRVDKKLKNTLNFLCSIHYDFETNKRNHPIFHAQLKSRPELIQQTMFQSYEIRNQKSDMLKTFRIPSTQHDIFSALTQFSADHLLSESIESYDKLIEIRKICDFFVSAESKSDLETEPNCMRSIRYYPD